MLAGKVPDPKKETKKPPEKKENKTEIIEVPPDPKATMLRGNKAGVIHTVRHILEPTALFVDAPLFFGQESRGRAAGSGGSAGSKGVEPERLPPSPTPSRESVRSKTSQKYSGQAHRNHILRVRFNRAVAAGGSGAQFVLLCKQHSISMAFDENN
jgi:hypothetical protein